MHRHHLSGNAKESCEVEVTLPRIVSVGLGNLCEVQSHCINHILGSTSHVVQFVGGGYVQFAYSDRGELLELVGQAVNVRLDAEGRISFGTYQKT